MILADRKDYKHGYQKHLAAYHYLKTSNSTMRSRCLLLETTHKDPVSSAEYHQLCRYGVKVKDRDKIGQYERVLNDIIEWIGDEIVR